jgi:hypothetical protein
LGRAVIDPGLATIVAAALLSIPGWIGTWISLRNRASLHEVKATNVVIAADVREAKDAANGVLHKMRTERDDARGQIDAAAAALGAAHNAETSAHQTPPAP